MTVFNEILAGRFNRYLQKFTSIKGGPPVPALGTEIGGQLDLNSIRIEDRYLFMIDQFWLTNSTGPTAAQNSAVRLRNPVGSNVIATVEFVGFWESVVDTAAPGIQITHSINMPNDLPSVGLASALDSRTQRAASVLRLSAGANVTALPTVVLTVPEVTANSFFGLTLYDCMQIPLLPGSALQVQTTVVNTHLEVNYKWTERFLEDSERT